MRWDLARNRTWALNREPRVFDTFLWLCPAPDRSYLLTGGEDGVPGVWKTGSGRRVARLLPPGGEPTSALSLSPDGRLAASGDRRGAVTLWRAACRRGYAAPQALCRVVSSRQALSIALQVDAVLARVQRLMNRGDFAAAAQCLGPLRQAGGHDRSPEAQRLWGTLYRHLARTTLERAWERAVVGRQPVAAISADGRWLALGGRAVMREDGLLHLVALEDDARRSLVLHRGFVGALAFSPCSRFLLSGGHDCTLALWDVARGALLATFNGHRNHVTAIRFGGDGRSVLSASGSLGRQGAVAEMILWDFPSGRPRHVLHGHGGKITAVDLSADGATALSGSVDGSARLWDLALGKPLRRIAFGAEVLGVCLDRQARSLLLCGRRPEIWIAAPDSGELLGRLEGHQEAVNSVILTPGGRHAITGGGSDAGDTTVRFWELASGSCLRVFSGHTAAVTGLCLSGDARLLVSASGGARPETRLWELDWRLGPPAAVA
jgi:WD40 repeat protein